MYIFFVYIIFVFLFGSKVHARMFLWKTFFKIVRWPIHDWSNILLMYSYKLNAKIASV